MKKNYKTLLLGLSIFLIPNFAFAQTPDELLNLMISKGLVSQIEVDSLRAEAAIKLQENPKDKTFSIDLEYRPRSEFREGYGQLQNDTVVPAFFTNQRTRLTFGYEIANKFNFQFSLQDIREYGRDDPRTTAGTVQVFEAYLEPQLSKNFSIRIGRQRIMYDNQRLFAQNDWRQNANSHDGINFRWNSTDFTTELAAAWNQTTEGFSNTGFFPVDQTGKSIVNYKLLTVNYLKWKLNKNFTLTSINCADGYQDAKNAETLHIRYTNGGRLDFEKNALYATFSGYIQHGRSAANKVLHAYYIQPEIKYVLKVNTTFRLGMEYMSGQDANRVTNDDNSFVPLYGVAHRFNGYMDLYTRFPNDLNNAGLVNPYLFAIQNISKKTSVGFYFHQFYSQNNFLDKDKKAIDKYLGFEQDILFNFKPNAYTNLEVGYSYYLPTESTVLIKKAKAGSEKEWQQWAYVMATFKPQLFKAKFNKL
jgi:Alginate export